MSCEEFRGLLGDHHAGDLVVEVRESFEVHLSGCEHCGHYLESYTHTIRVTRKLPKAGSLPADVEARLREALKDHVRSRTG